MSDVQKNNGFSWWQIEWLVVATISVAGVLVWLHRPVRAVAEAPTKAQSVSVQTAVAARMNVPQYLEGLGTVQAFNTVTITSRVEGQLQSVAFTEGQEVKQGDLLAQIDQRPYQAALDLATATKAKDDAQLENARHDLSRYLILQPKNLTSKQTLDTQKSLVAQLEAQVKADQANIDSAKTQLDYTSIKSPISGRTGVRLVDVGNNVHSTGSTGIVVVTQMQPISLLLTLPEDVLAQVNQAMAAGPVGVAAISRDGTTTLDKGALLLVDNQIDQTTGTIRLKATFPNAKNTLWPGQFVNARLLLQVQHHVLTIPAAAAQRGPDGIFTYVVKPDSTVEVRPLKTNGAEVDGAILVEGGLIEGEHVVISNQYRLQPGVMVSEEEKTKPASTGDSPK